MSSSNKCTWFYSIPRAMNSHGIHNFDRNKCRRGIHCPGKFIRTVKNSGPADPVLQEVDVARVGGENPHVAASGGTARQSCHAGSAN
jgi:hypothetical protein